MVWGRRHWLSRTPHQKKKKQKKQVHPFSTEMLHAFLHRSGGFLCAYVSLKSVLFHPLVYLSLWQYRLICLISHHSSAVTLDPSTLAFLLFHKRTGGGGGRGPSPSRHLLFPFVWNVQPSLDSGFSSSLSSQLKCHILRRHFHSAWKRPLHILLFPYAKKIKLVWVFAYSLSPWMCGQSSEHLLGLVHLLYHCLERKTNAPFPLPGWMCLTLTVR